MPEAPPPKSRLHPHKALPIAAPGAAAPSPPPPAAGAYAELCVTTNFTFLTGASHPDEYVERAAELGLHAIAVTDANSLAGIVRAHVAARSLGVRLVVGCRIVFTLTPTDWTVLVYPTSRAAYGRLCQLLTLGRRRAPKGECHLGLDDLLAHADGLLAVAVPPERWPAGRRDDMALLRRLREAFGEDDRLSLAASVALRQDDAERLERGARLARRLGAPLVAIGDVHYHVPERRPLQDVLTCIRHGCTIEQAGLRLFANAARHLGSPAEMARRFAGHEAALARSVEIADRAGAFSLDELRYRYPDEVIPAGKDAQQHLADLAWAGAAERYPGGVPEKVRGLIEHELRLIAELRYAHYFLTVHDIADFARRAGILYQGRGAAANSAVCYCLHVTAVDPDRVETLFERFVSKERDEPPDIDIDFEHERREEVIQYIYGKYGRERAALTAEVITYRARSAVREVGKALGLGLDTVDRLARALDLWSREGPGEAPFRSIGLDPDAPTVRRWLDLARELVGFPRHLGQHVGGFVITQDPLSTLVPIENAAMPDRTVIEWDKDDIEAMGMMKVDVLGLGMLTCIRKCFALLERHHATRHGLATIPPDDPAVYDMICRADTVGVFQIESRAQMSMLPRLRPRCYYDLVIEVAIVRPGPIQGDMVHPYLRRRNGEEPVEYASPEGSEREQQPGAVERILSRTLGVPLFQEQAMSLAIHCAGFTPGEADQLRRAIAAWKSDKGAILRFGEKILGGMLARGYARAFAERTFEQLQGFSEYGFPESHAASFALLAYVSSWLKHHHPAAYLCALLNSQPMGFYAPAQLVRDARRHGVEVRAVCVNASDWDATLEDGGRAVRLGMRLVRGLREEQARRVAEARARLGRIDDLARLRRVAGVRAETLRQLARADAFSSLGLTRQQALWQILRLREPEMPLFEAARAEAPLPEPAAADPSLQRLPPVSPFAEVHQDYFATGLSLKRHPLSFQRAWLAERGASTAAELADESRWPHGRRITVAGLTLVRQRPGTASGVLFMTLEDETGHVNLIVRPRVYERFRAVARHASAVLARGTVERQGEVIHVMVRELEDFSGRFADLLARSRDFR